jgi:hypothetical protein
MGDALDIAQTHGQHGLSTVQGLNLAFFIDAQDQGVVGWIQVQADDVPYLLDKKGIGGELKTTAAMGLQGKRLKQTVHGGAGNPADLGGLSDAPMRAGRGFAGEGAPEQSGNLFVLNAAPPTRPQLVIESGQAVLDKPLSPLAHGGISPAQATGDLGVALPLSRPEHQFGTRYQSMGQGAGSGQAAQLRLFVRGKSEGRLGASRDHARSLSQTRYLC